MCGIGGKCAGFRAKLGEISGHLPVATMAMMVEVEASSRRKCKRVESGSNVGSAIVCGILPISLCTRMKPAYQQTWARASRSTKRSILRQEYLFFIKRSEEPVIYEDVSSKGLPPVSGVA